MEYICKPRKIAIYVNEGRKSTAKIKAETGCTALVNGGIFDMNTFEPLCHLKVDGEVLAKDQWGYFGFAWNDVTDLDMVVEYGAYRNYICCVEMIRNGNASTMIYPDEMGGYRPRTAMGVFDDGRVWLYASADKNTPESLQKLAMKKGVKHAIMLDGGGSTQGACPTETVNAGRTVHNYICVWEDEPISEGGDTMFKIALGAGHGVKTAGKRCLKSLDPNETREWVLNDRICDYIEKYLKDYEGYELLRLDDSDDGAEDVALATRVNKANSWGADYYLSIHHNAGINGGKGGGIVAYSYPGSKAGAEWRDAFYDALIAKTGLKGNRATPKTTANFYVLKYTKMVAGLLELGFMDSKVDTPQILTEEFAQGCAQAIVEVLAAKGKLTRKKAVEEEGGLWRVQVGAFSSKAAAESYAEQLKKQGLAAYVTQ